MKIEIKKGDKFVTYYQVFECPKGSGLFIPARKYPTSDGIATSAFFHKRELAEEFGKAVSAKRRGWHNGKPNAVPMDWCIRPIRLPAREKERAAAKRAYEKHRKANPL
jgi:hypothetical protein